MLILSLDTTTRSGSVALVRDGAVIYQQIGDPARTHAQRLPLDLMSACAAAGVTIEDVALFAVAAGPGSFTGLRVGIATIQGLAMAGAKRVVPVSTLEALAVSAPGRSPRVAAWMDAQRGEVFAQIFDREDANVTALTSAINAPAKAVLDLHRAELDGAIFHGDGAVRYKAEIAAALGESATVIEPVSPLAGAIGTIAARDPQRAVLPHAIVPIYVRRPDAEIARDRRTATR